MAATYQVKLADEAADYYDRLSSDKQELVDSKLELIAHDPFHGKPLKHDLKGLFSVRLGPLRLVYKVDRANQTVTVVELAPRDKVYKQVAHRP